MSGHRSWLHALQQTDATKSVEFNPEAEDRTRYLVNGLLVVISTVHDGDRRAANFQLIVTL